jgi:hypothetical protein
MHPVQTYIPGSPPYCRAPGCEGFVNSEGRNVYEAGELNFEARTEKVRLVLR